MMPKINVYLPDELAEAVKAAKLPVSTVCQRALEDALRGAASVREGARSVGAPYGRSVTGRLQRAVDLASEAAATRGHRSVGTEHLLLGMLDEGGNLALQVLRALDVDPADVRTEVEPRLEVRQPSAGQAAPDGASPERTPIAERTLELAGQEAIRMGHNYLGCEHLLLGLVAEEDGVGGRVLRSMGVELTVTRRAVVTALSGYVHATQRRPQVDAQDVGALAQVLERLDRIEQRLAAS
jgi:ATP-dependent Clp protease ATP-binding subunit ClpC